jgi:hypothetical protein
MDVFQNIIRGWNILFHREHNKDHYVTKARCLDEFESFLMDNLSESEATEKYNFLIDRCAHIVDYEKVERVQRAKKI